MANPNDLRESFPTTESASTGGGVPLSALQPGSASAAANGAVGFAFQDVNGNVILPSLDAQGRVPVSTEAPGTRLRSNAVVAGGLLSATGSTYSGFQTVTQVSLTASHTVQDFKGMVASRRGSLFQLVYQDSSSSVVLSETIVDSGQFTAQIGIGTNDTFNVPASASAPIMLIRAGNFDKASDLHATLSVVQF